MPLVVVPRGYVFHWSSVTMALLSEVLMNMEKGCCFEIKIRITHVFVINSKKRIDQLYIRVIDIIFVLLLRLMLCY